MMEWWNVKVKLNQTEICARRLKKIFCPKRKSVTVIWKKAVYLQIWRRLALKQDWTSKKLGVHFIFFMPPWGPIYLFLGLILVSVWGNFQWIFGKGGVETQLVSVDPSNIKTISKQRKFLLTSLRSFYLIFPCQLDWDSLG